MVTVVLGPAKAAKAVKTAKMQVQDDFVMSTNDNSIVSKRSVERLYFPNEPHYFRFFVKKFQRRAPLINRGYHLRMHVVDVTVREFLKRPSSKAKVVINLGCGSDVLPWQTLSRYPDYCQGVKFVDVDFPELMLRKCAIVTSHPELSGPLTSLELPDDPLLLLRSEQYYQVGCDLRQLPLLQEALAKIVDIKESEFLFVAEVSITYMDTESADALIQWASSIGDAEFCLLEQILPDGPNHPFAKTMIEHFLKLKTPLKSVHKYPTLSAQERRFSGLGWPSVRSSSLWQTWTDARFFSPLDRCKLDEVEPFDEWEEFALFASHYCLVRARNRPDAVVGFAATTGQYSSVPCATVDMQFRENRPRHGTRRLGALLIVKDALGRQYLANFMGLGPENRLRSCDIYSEEDHAEDLNLNLHQGGPGPRMCFTLTDLGETGFLLAGGRSSPMNPSRDTWVFRKDVKCWSRVHDLPLPLYRHAATRLGDCSLALLVGGKSGPSAVFSGCLLYHPEHGWTECLPSGPACLEPIFGAVLMCSGRKAGTLSIFHGVLAGGMTQDGRVSKSAFRWHLDVSDIKRPVIHFESLEESSSVTTHPPSPLLSRFGASAVRLGDVFLILGGIIGEDHLHQRHDILVCHISDTTCEVISSLNYTDSLDSRGIPRPLLVGASVAVPTNKQFVIMGGGAVAFSFGSFWTKGVYTFDSKLVSSPSGRKETHPPASNWIYSKTVPIVDEGTHAFPQGPTNSAAARPTPIPYAKLDSEGSFEKILREGRPVIFSKLDLGSCTSLWNGEYLVRHIGADRKVVVHESPVQGMDFVTKNFSYATKAFGDLMDEVDKGGKLYLRALSTDKPADAPATLDSDFPSLSADFALPAELAFVKAHLFSSVLRISGPVNMWLHYDVMANVYCQIAGTKRFLLFPPSDVSHLAFAPGASSSSIDAFSSPELPPALSATHPREATLGPGDVLFIPPLWSHTATPVSPKSVAVNVFFRDLEAGYAPGRDVYGNRDLAAYEKGRQEVARIVNGFKGLPSDAKEFYLRRLADELRARAAE